MTLDEWSTKWGTGVIEGVPGRVVNVEGNPKITLKMELHQAPVGDLIKAYIEHLNTPWWRRERYWKLVEEWMREKLNGALGGVSWHWG